MTVCKPNNNNNIHPNYNDDPINTDNTNTTPTVTAIDIPFDKIFLIVQDTVTGLKKLYINQIIYQKYSKLLSMMMMTTTTTTTTTNNENSTLQQRLIII